MKRTYTIPSTQVFLIEGGQQPLAESEPNGVKATISGYDAAGSGEGFSQSSSSGIKRNPNPVVWDE